MPGWGYRLGTLSVETGYCIEVDHFASHEDIGSILLSIDSFLTTQGCRNTHTREGAERFYMKHCKQKYVKHMYDFGSYSLQVRGLGRPCPPGSYTYATAPFYHTPRLLTLLFPRSTHDIVCLLHWSEQRSSTASCNGGSSRMLE